jgi:hypothetical protein
VGGGRVQFAENDYRNGAAPICWPVCNPYQPAPILKWRFSMRLMRSRITRVSCAPLIPLHAAMSHQAAI